MSEILLKGERIFCVLICVRTINYRVHVLDMTNRINFEDHDDDISW